jgi:predicted dehydrogenase
MGLSHAAIVSAHPQVTLAAICDTTSLILDGFKKYTAVKIYSDFKKMLDTEPLDFVFVATPTKLHYPMVKYAFEKGVHVFCEKPFSLTTTEGAELVSIARQRNLVNQVGYHNHFIGTFIELKRLLQTGVIGDIVNFKGEAYGPVVVKEKSETWRSKPEEGGGCLYDYASHVINLIQEIIGRPSKIYGSLLQSIYSKGVDDAVYALLQLENKVTGTLSVNWSDETYRKMSTSITVEGKNGKIICDATEIKIYLKEADTKENLKKGWTIKYITDFALPVNFYLRGEEYSAQVDYFIDNVINGRQGTINTFEQALYSDKVIEMIKEKDQLK